MSKSFKTLQVRMNPSFNWDDEYERIKNKLTTSIKKTMRAEIKTHQAHAHLNIHILENALFGCRIVQFNSK